MDWSRIKRRRAGPDGAPGVYVDLDELVRIQFRAKDFSFKPQQPVSSVLAGRYASRLRGRGLNFEELRGYLPGDDIRHMDWKVTARTREPHVRVYTEDKDRTVLVVVDQRRNMFFGTRQRLKSVTAAQLAALAAWRAIDVGDRVGAVVFNDERVAVVRPGNSTRTVMEILGHIVEQNHELAADAPSGTRPERLNEVLKKTSSVVTHDALVVLITDGFGVDAATERVTARIAEHNDVLAFLVHDPWRLDPGPVRLTASDGELQMDVDLTKEPAPEKVRADYREEQEQIARFLRGLSAPLLMVSNEGDVVMQVRRLLGVTGGGP
jgi:uncharacterized protein (DUF58 family)